MEFFIRESTVRAGIPQAQSGEKKNNFNIKTVSATGLPDVATETSKYSCQISSTTHEEVYDGMFSVKKMKDLQLQYCWYIKTGKLLCF